MAKSEKRTFPVLQMGCAACAARVENAVREAAGVASAAVNFSAGTLTVEYDPATASPESLRDTVRRTGYDLVIEDAAPDAMDEMLKKK